MTKSTVFAVLRVLASCQNRQGRRGRGGQEYSSRTSTARRACLVLTPTRTGTAMSALHRVLRWQP